MMAVDKGPSGRRSVQMDVEVMGKPDAVWAAVATGPGISSWFVPAEVDGRVGGKSICHFGPGESMDLEATIVDWDPPRRFVAESAEGPGSVTTTWTVETRADELCTVRVVHGWFADNDEWDSWFERHAEDWVPFFKILRFRLMYFPGEMSTLVQLGARFAGSMSDAFEQLIGPLGIAQGAEGQPFRTNGNVPAMSGTVLEAQNAPGGFSVILKLETPGRSIAHLAGFAMGEAVYISVRFYVYGPEDAERTGAIGHVWQEWLARRFPEAAAH